MHYKVNRLCSKLLFAKCSKLYCPKCKKEVLEMPSSRVAKELVKKCFGLKIAVTFNLKVPKSISRIDPQKINFGSV